MLNYNQHNMLIIAFTFLSVITYEINSSEVRRPRGVSLSRAPLYPPGENFVCFDGSLTIPFTRVNDDYCDCQDGSDEPGTSACPNGIFHCSNAGHQALNIPSSRVNDGICDCCDGSDEYDKPEAKCLNSCFELGQSARIAAQKRAEILRLGSVKRNELIQRGGLAQSEKKDRIEQLKKQKSEAELVKAEKEKIKNEIEQYENAALEKYRQVEEEEKSRKQTEEKEVETKEAEAYFNKLDGNQDGKIDLSEIKVRALFDTDKNGEVTDDEAKYFLNDKEEISNVDEFLEKSWSRVKPYAMMEKGMFQPPEQQKDDDEEEEEEEEEEIDENADATQHEEPSDVEELDESEDHTSPDIEKHDEAASPDKVYDEETQNLINQANDARQDYNNADRAVRDIEKEISDIEDYLGKDYGPENEFSLLHGECFEYTDREYIYRLCLFDKALQIPRNGGSETRLGVWSNWSGEGEHKYMQMLYERGTSCWNGPQRSTRVHLTCGVENRLTNVNEPNRCEYEFQFETPAVCYLPPEAQNSDDHDEL